MGGKLLKSEINTESNLEIKLYSEIIKNNGVVFDVGARDSNLPLINQNANYFLFEPIKYNFNNLVDRFKNKKNIKLINSALSDKEEITTIFLESESISKRINFNYIWRYVKPERVVNGEQEIINCNTLKKYIDDNNISKINLLKIDVEGYELKVITGLFEHLKIVENIVFEYSVGTYESSNASLIDLLNQLNDFGLYLLYNNTISKLDGSVNDIYNSIKNIDNCNIHAKRIK
jgi:FkbM family methyltransferase